jgi:hypothetical protein
MKTQSLLLRGRLLSAALTLIAFPALTQTVFTIVSPQNGQQFLPGQAIELRGQLRSSDTPWSVEFFDNSRSIGKTRSGMPLWWTDASGGRHVITAIATDGLGHSVPALEPVTIQVGPGPTLPVVTIIAEPWRTAEPCPTCFVAPAILTIERTDPIDSALTVALAIDGTATPGDDYEPLPSSVQIPAGQRSIQLKVLPRDDQLAEGPEIVRVRLVPRPSPLQDPTYLVSFHANDALVTINDDESGAPLARLDIVAPANEAQFEFPSIIELSAMAVNTENEVYGPVEFYADGQLVAHSRVVASTRPPIPGLASVHTAWWTNPPPGGYVLTARTLLSLNESITSPPVKIIVQDNDPPQPTIVSIRTEDGIATELSPMVTAIDPARFRISRSGDLSRDLAVFFSVAGSATPEKDYQALVSPVLMPAGAASVALDVRPVYDELEEGVETVVVKLEPSPLMGPQPTYDIDPHNSSAVAEIFDRPQPPRPIVRIETVAPVAEESSYPYKRMPLIGQLKISRTGPVIGPLSVFVRWSGMAQPGKDYEAPPFLVTIPEGADSTLVPVQAIPDDLPEGLETVLATLSNCPPDPTLPPCFDLAVDPAHASATVFIRDDGLTEVSLVITRPANGAQFRSGEVITINAVAIDLDGYISRVEFLDGGEVIGVSEINFIVAPPPGTPIHHTFEWTGAAPGSHTLTARAVRATGQIVESRPVTILVDSGASTVVAIHAEDSRATELPPLVNTVDPARFRISRSGDLSIELLVFFSVAGSSTPEKDYQALVSPVRIPAGAASVALDVSPVYDELQEGVETVVVKLEPSPLAGPQPTYDIDPNNSSAVAEIFDLLQPSRPVVRIETVAPVAEETAAPLERLPLIGQFRISRSGPVTGPLPVYLHWRGMATPGKDYETPPFMVTIPEGADSALVPVKAIPDDVPEGLETVVATLSNCPPGPILPPCFDFAIDPAQASATVFIRDDSLTEASLVITRPLNGARFKFGDVIPITAIAIDLEGYISRVEFLDAGKVIGASEFDFFVAPPPGTPIQHTFPWAGAAPGSHTLTARAVRATGETVESGSVNITVESDANQAPIVAITQPAQGANIPPNTPIEIIVQTKDPDGYVPTVQFFENGRKLGEQTVVFIHPPDPGQPQTFSFVWRTPEPGRHALTARAIDNSGGSALSEPVAITVGASQLPLVVIRATDSLAVEPVTGETLDTANFRIRRLGPTNAPLTVAYSLHGTAENGEDYEELTGSLTIPAGSFSANLTVRPLADGLPERLESVIVRLEEQPEYLLGLRRRAHAIISDTRPGPGRTSTTSTWVASDGCLVGRYTAPFAGQFRIEASTDLLNWQTVLTATAPDGTLDFGEEDTGTVPRRFFRVAPETAAGAADWVSDQ